MNDFFIIDISVDFDAIQQNFPEWTFKAFKHKPTEKEQKITVISCNAKHQETIAKDWKKLTSFITTDIISKNENDYERWNSYLLFVCDEEVEKFLKFQIENDKFSMRKVVISKHSQSNDENFIIKALNRKILAAEIDYRPKIEPAKDLRGQMNKPILHYQESLNDKNKLIGTSDNAKKQREKWLEKELSRIESNEN